ncbi:MAG: hypothetical protein KF718_31405 [Polyangiaceae bacterium]|nr:hypothetical protein [Polyangiaceae bacterium]
MKAVLDAGALVAVERRDRHVGALLRVLQQRRVPLWTSAAVLAQVWRDGARQATLARLLQGVGVRPLAMDDGKQAGALLGSTGTDDVVDAHLALLLEAGDRVLTSDSDDVLRLLAARRVRAIVVPI